MKGVCYVGPTHDYSGYGEANRHFIAALNSAQIPLKVHSVSYVNETSDFGKLGELCKQLNASPIEYAIKILHVTPDQYYRHMEKGKYNIGHLFWETSKLPHEFSQACNLMQEIWTGSETNAEAIRRSGVKVPIFVAPQPIEVQREQRKPYKIRETDDETFLFYSIFEWTERKNPVTLIRAYLEEFSQEENVALIVKTYLDNFGYQQQRFVMAELAKLRYQFGQGRGKLMLYKHLMDRSQIERLHITGSCYVTAHRGEGWGIPIVEAMLAGNPVITTGYNGVHDYLNQDLARLLPYRMVGVSNNRNQQWYASDQAWADVDVKALRQAMREMFTNQQQAKQMGARAQEFVKKHFNFETVGQLLKQRLEVIERKFL